jgi:succinate-semialdehyde dehydrogenase/glutarate-semialdehyde dehydrogenase
MYPQLRMLIDGVWEDGPQSGRLKVINPFDNSVLGEVPMINSAGLVRTIDSARRGFESWSQMSPSERANVLRRGAASIRRREEEIARIITLEQGKIVAEARFEVKLAADALDWYADEGRRAYGRLIPSNTPDSCLMVTKEPVGVVAAFSPWNAPVMTAMRKVAGALGAGCSIIIKPSEETPGALMELVRCLADAGLPKGALSLIYGDGPLISSTLIDSPDVDKISFTGSTQVGQELMARSAYKGKRTTMELGGNAPFIVLEDADPVLAGKLAALGKFRNAGQICTSPSRFYVHESLIERFLDTFVAEARSIVLGSGLDEATTMGPLANSRRLSAIETLVDSCIAEKCEIRTGGKRSGDRGNLFEPTIVTNITDESTLVKTEPFGPIASVMPFTDLDDVIKRANASPYGLAGYIVTPSARNANYVSRRLQVGVIGINTHVVLMTETPFGGVKLSGHGSEGGLEGLESYLITKFINHKF